MSEAKTMTEPVTENKSDKTVKYLVTCTCYDGKRLLRENEVIELPANDKPFCSDHFKKL
ncbi:MAG: hypothetical protein J6S85_01755 [Methanobrevibacter sp.]|nr:hypothetical protein [Methanobrevibacter sp.]MBO7712260.1 hypothetical protein [Methanobrevibacter sp.]